jgi:hypothetical protein
MIKKINWLAWLVLVILWNYGFPNATPLQDVLVAVILSILFIIIKKLQSRDLQKRAQEVNLRINEGRLIWEFTTIINLHVAIKL